MNTMQIRKASLAISSCLLLIACKASQRIKIFTKESYGVANASLIYLYEIRNLISNAPFFLDSIVIYSEPHKFKKDDFKRTIENFQITKNANLNIPKCADSINYDFNFNKLKSTSQIGMWDTKKIKFSKATNKAARSIKREDQRVKLSSPIFNKKYTKALILMDYRNEGECIYYLTNTNDTWKVKGYM
jgi:hypothetical protein